jgi:hypothetical protein
MNKYNDKNIIDINKYPTTIKFKSTEELLAIRRKRRERLVAESLLRIHKILNSNLNDEGLKRLSDN